jgi:hypothetical protein
MQPNFHTPIIISGVGTLALINAALAQFSGKSPIIWFIVSLAFGPLVTLYLIISFKRK